MAEPIGCGVVGESANASPSLQGNYDQYVKTRLELEENQMKRFHWEQDQIAHMKVRPAGRLASPELVAL